MIIGIGTDILRVQRVRTLYQKFPEKFPRRLLSEHERELYRGKNDRGRHLAKRFAAKEAILKALGTGLANGICFHDIEVLTGKAGQPVVRFSGMALQCLQEKVKQVGADLDTLCHLSISDEEDYVVAFAVISV